MAVSAANGIVWQYRQNVGGFGVVVAGPTSQAAPAWIRVVREGTRFTGSWSPDGTTWTEVGSITINMSSSALVGLASTSDAATRLNRVEFTDVAVSNTAPTVATAAAATMASAGTTATLSVLGADDHGEPNLTYRWTAQGPAAVTFSGNGTNAAKDAVATFSKAGTYTLTATLTDSSGLTATSAVSVTVAQRISSITVTPGTATLVAGLTKQYSATAVDQFGSSLAPQPSLTWLAIGAGTISSTGLFTAPATAAITTITATAQLVTGQATITTTNLEIVVAAGQTTTEPGGRSGIATLFKRGGGTLVLTGANAHSGGTVIEEGVVVVQNQAALGSGRLEVRAGARFTLDIGLDELVVPSIVIDPTSRIDLGAGRLTVASGLTEADVRRLLLDGRGAGGWDGERGIMSRAVVPGSRELGYVVDAGRVTIGYVAPGDTNLDGVVDVADIANFVSNIDSPNAAGFGWADGDFNYDGIVDQLDLSAFLGEGLFDQGLYLSANDAAFAALGRN